MRAFVPLTVLLTLSSARAAAPGDPDQGARYFRACAACHSLEPGRNMTGPSLSALFGRRAGSLPSFHRYSPALKSADITWDDTTLDAWLAKPTAFVPGNWMTFAGIDNAQIRADLIAYLKVASNSAKERQSVPGKPKESMMGTMGMGGGPEQNLKGLAPKEQVRAIDRCEDGYGVTTEDGEFREYWERNLRFKTDSSARGPEKGKPVILPAGMLGDRSTIVFAGPDEISRFITAQCAR